MTCPKWSESRKLPTCLLPWVLPENRCTCKSTKTGCQDPTEKECICGAGGSLGGVTALGTLARSSAVTPGSTAWPWLPNMGSVAALRRPPATAPTEIWCQGLFSQNWHHLRLSTEFRKMGVRFSCHHVASIFQAWGGVGDPILPSRKANNTCQEKWVSKGDEMS